MNDSVILVDQNDIEIGTGEKLQVHRDGQLHRAFSVFIYNSAGELLLQRRALDKYHSGGLWTNTCCSHPRPGEHVTEAAQRRLREEMGIESSLRELCSFIYKTTFSSGLHEHEYDHVLIGEFDGTPVPDRAEVAAWKWQHPKDIVRELAAHPERFTVWFPIAFNHIMAHSSV